MSVRGTRDLIPSSYMDFKYLFDVWRGECERFGFIEYDLPVLVDPNIFLKKSGPALMKQVFNFKDKGNRWIGLRPELTPQLGEVFLKNDKSLSKPLKWFSVPRCFRYERPQKGRLREFFQLNVDVVGNDSVYADIEVVCLGISILKKLGLGKKDFFIKISSRELLDVFLDSFSNKSEIYAVIDDKSKVSKDEFVSLLKRIGLRKKDIDWIQAFTSIKDVPKVGLKKLKKLCAGNDRALKVFEYFSQFFKGVEDYGFIDYVILDFSVVRGLAYYKGIVFEAFDRDEEYRSILGGGSYFFDKTPAIGFGFGDTVVLEILREKKLIPSFEGLDFFIIMNKKTVKTGFKLITKLRSDGFSVSYDFNLRSFDKQLGFANKLGAKKAIFLGDKEIGSGTYLLKDLSTGKQISKSLEI